MFWTYTQGITSDTYTSETGEYSLFLSYEENGIYNIVISRNGLEVAKVAGTTRFSSDAKAIAQELFYAYFKYQVN